MRIPILNIYYLLCYAWDRLREAEIVDVGALDSHELSNLFAHVLDGGTRHLLKRGVDRDYLEYRDTIPGVRGKIDFGVSLRELAFENARAHCVFSELSFNVLHNQILKTTLRKLAHSDGLDAYLHEQLLWLYREFDSVDEVALSSRLFRRVRLNRNNRFYDFLMKVCQLAHESMLVDETTGRYRFRDFVRDEQRMPVLFQAFVRNFYAREQSRFRVAARAIQWQDVKASAEDLAYLPQMQTDISLEASSRAIIIDTKFYEDAFQTRFAKETVRSDHLYQLFSYLVNFGRWCGKSVAVEGILLYPTVERSFDLHYDVMGLPLRVVSLDLAAPWRHIHEALLSLLS